MISEGLPAQDSSALPFWLPEPARISAAAGLGRFAPSSENTLITSLGKQRLARFVNENNKISASWPILVITSIQFCSPPPNGSSIFKETQKLFSWQEPNLAAGLGRSRHPGQQPRIARGVQGGEPAPFSTRHEQPAEQPVSALFHRLLPGHLHFMYPFLPLRRLFCCWKVPNRVWQLPAAMPSAKAAGNPLENSRGRM